MSVVGGTSPYAFQWSNGDITTFNDSLPTGVYSLNIIDINNCTAFDIGVINEPQQLLVSSAIQHVNCYGESTGIIDLNVVGGTSPYQFIWDNGVVSEDLFNVSSGIYSVTVTDINNCSVDQVNTISQPNDSIIIVDSIVDISCFGISDGYILLDVFGGTPPYSYLWSSGQNTSSISQLSAAQYSVQISDANSCIESYSAFIEEGSEFQVNANTQNLKCYNDSTGSIELTIIGGNPPFQVNWNDGNSDIQRENLLAGNYLIQIIDAINCESTLQIELSEPFELSIELLKNDAIVILYSWDPLKPVATKLFCEAGTKKDQLSANPLLLLTTI